MSGGSWEHIMSNVSNNSGSYVLFPSSSGFTSAWYTTSTAKYLTTYAKGSSYNNQAAYNRSRLGDATGEVVTSTGGSGGWYGDNAEFAYTNSETSAPCWFLRGGNYNTGYNTKLNGIFSFDSHNGDNSRYDLASRAILVSLK